MWANFMLFYSSRQLRMLFIWCMLRESWGDPAFSFTLTTRLQEPRPKNPIETISGRKLKLTFWYNLVFCGADKGVCVLVVDLSLSDAVNLICTSVFSRFVALVWPSWSAGCKESIIYWPIYLCACESTIFCSFGYRCHLLFVCHLTV